MSRQLFVQWLLGDRAKWQVTSADGGIAALARRCRALFYMVGDRLRVHIDCASSAACSRSPKHMFDIHPPHGLVSLRNVFAVSRDGERFLVDTVVEEAKPAPITILLN